MTGDLVERLRSALAERETLAEQLIVRIADGDYTGVDWDDLHPLLQRQWETYTPAHVLRTIQAHRALLDLLPLMIAIEERDEDEHGPLDVNPAAELLAALASIYFPEGTE